MPGWCPGWSRPRWRRRVTWRRSTSPTRWSPEPSRAGVRIQGMHARTLTRPLAVLAGLLLVVGLAACGDDDDASTARRRHHHERSRGGRRRWRHRRRDRRGPGRGQGLRVHRPGGERARRRRRGVRQHRRAPHTLTADDGIVRHGARRRRSRGRRSSLRPSRATYAFHCLDPPSHDRHPHRGRRLSTPRPDGRLEPRPWPCCPTPRCGPSTTPTGRSSSASPAARSAIPGWPRRRSRRPSCGPGGRRRPTTRPGLAAHLALRHPAQRRDRPRPGPAAAGPRWPPADRDPGTERRRGAPRRRRHRPDAHRVAGRGGARRAGRRPAQALVEVHWRGRPYADVADELGVPEGTVKSRVYYGLRAMRGAARDARVA